MRQTFYITTKMLKEMEACRPGVRYFRQQFGNKAVLDEATFNRLMACPLGNGYVHWLVNFTWSRSPVCSLAEREGSRVADEWHAKDSYAVFQEALAVLHSHLRSGVLRAGNRRIHPINYPLGSN